MGSWEASWVGRRKEVGNCPEAKGSPARKKIISIVPAREGVEAVLRWPVGPENPGIGRSTGQSEKCPIVKPHARGARLWILLQGCTQIPNNLHLTFDPLLLTGLRSRFYYYRISRDSHFVISGFRLQLLSMLEHHDLQSLVVPLVPPLSLRLGRFLFNSKCLFFFFLVYRSASKEW